MPNRGRIYGHARILPVILLVCLAYSWTLLGHPDAGLAMPAGAVTTPKDSPLGQILFILRGLSIQPPNQPAQLGKLRAPVFSRYRLRTGAGQKASIRFRDGTTLHLNQRTDAVLNRHTLSMVAKQ